MKTKLLLAVIVMAVTGCEDVPLLPKWDADMAIPIASRGIAFSAVFPATIPASPSPTLMMSTPVETQQLDDAVGDLLDGTLRGGSIVFTVTSTLQVNGSDTLYIANSAGGLNATTPGTIVAPFTLSSTAASITDTIVIPQAGIDMLQSTAQAGGTLHVQMRGSAQYVGPAPRVLNASDSLTVSIRCLCTVAVSR